MADSNTCSIDDTHNFQTPPWCCDLMVSLLPKDSKVILEPTPGAGNLVAAIEATGRTALTFNSYEEIDWGRKFDAVLMNPPFTPMALGYKILDDCMQRCGNIVALLPWLTLINSQKRATGLVQFGLVSVTNLPRSTFKGSRIQTCLFELQRGFKGPVKLDFATDPTSKR